MISLSNLLLLSQITLSQSHFLWHQRVATDKGDSVSSFFTFSEKPGIENVGDETFARMVFGKGVNVHYSDLDSLTLTLETNVHDNYITAKLPDELPPSYVLEAFCQWGIFGEGDGPPSLLQYYTSASRSRTNDDFAQVQKFSTNMFRVDLQIKHGTKECKGQGDEDHRSVCVEMVVIYDNTPVPQTEMTLYHGESDPIKITSDANGFAYMSIQRADGRVFVRANHKVNSQGETADGDAYDIVSNWATSVLELSSSLEQSPFDSPQEASMDPATVGENSYNSDADNSEQKSVQDTAVNVQNGSILVLVIATLVGSFLGSFLSERTCAYHHHRYQQAPGSSTIQELEYEPDLLQQVDSI